MHWGVLKDGPRLPPNVPASRNCEALVLIIVETMRFNAPKVRSVLPQIINLRAAGSKVIVM